MIAVGEKLNLGFTVRVVAEGAPREVRFADLLMRRTIVSVHMRNNTPSCDRQNDSLLQHAAEIGRAGYDITAVSRDTCASHLRYAAGKRGSYLLVSDPEDQFARVADTLVKKSM